mmetsp:Transcript_7036/g.23591  ORF Transcript_7036/g.23591 Transcript_7036/m.23591 type:complete len:212 (+) Transcript_7036:316-951(+)
MYENTFEPNATAVVSDVASMAFAAQAKCVTKASSLGRPFPPRFELAALNASHITIASSHPMPINTNGTRTFRKDTNFELLVARTKKNALGNASATPSTAFVVTHALLVYTRMQTNTKPNAPAANFKSPNTSAPASSSEMPPPACSTRMPAFAASLSQYPPGSNIFVYDAAHFRYKTSCSSRLSVAVAYPGNGNANSKPLLNATAWGDGRLD